MYRLLIVDDEPIIVEGLTELFQQTDLSLEVYQAFDGKEALDITRRLRMDIVLTDIEMPEMNGIELQREVKRLWPRCKVIFLTGYNEFEYIQSSVRAGAVDYVLKTEGDAPIMAAIVEAVRQISEEVTYEQLIANAQSQLKLALPALRQDYFNGLLQGEPSTFQSRKEQFAALDIPLDSLQPIITVIGRIDQWREGTVASDKPLFVFSVNNIFNELFAQDFTIVQLNGEHNRIVWLMQPKTGKHAEEADEYAMDSESRQHYMLGMLESVQTACRNYLKLVCSFAVGSEPFKWSDISDKYDRLSQLFERGLGLGIESLLSDEHSVEGGQRRLRGKIKRIRMLDHYLAQKECEKFYTLFDDIVHAVGESSVGMTGLHLEVYYDLTAIFVSHINRLEAFLAMSDKVPMHRLFAVQEHASWAEASAFFRQLAGELFTWMENDSDQETSEVVNRVHDYVMEHISGDLSLNRLADHVYLTPFYLSRLYKQKTGRSISDYITETRIEKAKQLLFETPLKIHEIGMKVGYDSAPYFTRFFKKATRLTPQEFRDSLKKI